MNAPDSSQTEKLEDLHGKDADKEAAVKDERHWVRLTRLCNQHCLFCLDSWNQNGSYVDTEELKAYIKKGREEGRTRLVLSGGEPTIHPDFLRLVRYGKRLGYGWVQTVTNGMKLAYPKFARAAVLAGLDEVTFSIHGHTKELHDYLTDTPGAYELALRGMRNLQAIGGIVVNVDVVINRQNYKHLREILDFFMGMGVHEFDMLYIVPFGRGFQDHREALFFDLDDEAYPYFQDAFEVSKLPGVYVWTNRLPVKFLENYEHLIQDPHKLRYEIQGGRHNFEGLARWGVPPDCFGERCDHCFLARICRDTLMPYQSWFKEGGFERVRVRVDGEEQPSERRIDAVRRQEGRSYAYVAPDTAAAVAAFAAWEKPASDHPAAERSVELEDGSLPAAGALEGLDRPIERWVLRGTAALESLLLGEGAEEPAICGPLSSRVTDFEVVLERESVAWMLEHEEEVERHADRLVLSLRNHEYLSDSRATDPSPDDLRALGKLVSRFRNVPRCVSGHTPEGSERSTLDTLLVDDKGLLDLDAYVHHYVVEEYYSRSVRCDGCALSKACGGLHINYVRNHGFAVCQPLGEDEVEDGELPVDGSTSRSVRGAA